jgi:MFS family permease
MAEPPRVEHRPAALPPAERTIGQLVAESIQFYGHRFWTCLALGVAPAAVAVVFASVSREWVLILAPTVSGALVSATFVWASSLVLEAAPPRRRLVAAWLFGWLVFAPVPFLVLAFVIPGLLWLAALGLVVPVLVVEEIPVRAALRRAWQLARADFVHALGSLFTLAVVVILSQSVLVFILRGFGDADVLTSLFLASVVLSPLLFVGTALLYVDQAARVQ